MRIKMGELLDEYEVEKPQRGHIVHGEIVLIGDKVAYVDIGANQDAIVPSKDLNLLDEDFLDNISVGDEVPVYIVETAAHNGSLEVSIDKGLEEGDWRKAEKMLAEDKLVELDVTGYNKGGLLVTFGRLEGFIPNSLVPEINRGADRSAMKSIKAGKIGETILARIIEVDRQNRRFVLSARAAQDEQRKRRMAELAAGQKITGRVTNLVPFGAFIDLGGIDGLLHISNIAWTRVDHPSEILETGEEIEVLIESVDLERERISLNRKALTPSPFVKFEQDHFAGEILDGVVMDVKDFGAFVQLTDDIVGLVHVTEMPLTATEASPAALIQPGDRIRTEILEIDAARERVRLSTRRTGMVLSAEEDVGMMDEPQLIAEDAVTTKQDLLEPVA